MSLDTKLLQEICDQISSEIDAVVSIFAERGEIVASSRRKRIGDFHAGASGVREDALACVRMAIAMCERMGDLVDIWRDMGLETPLRCRMGINTGFCTVGNFGSEDRMDGAGRDHGDRRSKPALRRQGGGPRPSARARADRAQRLRRGALAPACHDQLRLMT
jgi:hypothetical protein